MILKPFMIEIIVEFAIAVFSVIIRIFVRTRLVGFRGWQGDDWLILLVIICFTLEIAFFPLTVNEQVENGLSQVKEGDYSRVTDAQQVAIKQVALWDIGGWIMYATVIWSCKGCMLFIYNRLSFGLWQEKVIRAAAIACVLTYVSVVITVTCHCLPLNKFWAKTDHPARCTLDLENFYVVGITNFLTDALILAVPIPLLWRIRLPWRRKLIIALFLCSGVFAMVCTILRTVISVIIMEKTEYDKAYGTVLGWACRENFVAIIVVNAPCIKPLFTSNKWFNRSGNTSQVSGDSEGRGIVGSGGSHVRWGKRKVIEDTGTVMSDIGINGAGGVGVREFVEAFPNEKIRVVDRDGWRTPPESLMALEGKVRVEDKNEWLTPPQPAATRNMSISERQRKMSVGFEDLVEGIVEATDHQDGRRASRVERGENSRRALLSDNISSRRGGVSRDSRRWSIIQSNQKEIINFSSRENIVEVPENVPDDDTRGGLFKTGYQI